MALLRGRRSVIVTGAALLLVASGCGGAARDEPSAGSSSARAVASPTSSPTLSESPAGPVLPEYPEAATRSDAAGQEAFVRHWFEVYNYGRLTGDTAPVKALSLQDDANDLLWTRIDDLYAAGGRIDGSTYSVSAVSPGELGDGGMTVIGISISLDSGIQVEADGTESQLDAVEPQSYEMVARFADHRWQFVSTNS